MHGPSMPELSDALGTALGGDSRTYAHYDVNEQHAVAIFEAVGTPRPRLTTYATASLHAFWNTLEGQDICVDLLMVGAKDSPIAANMVARSAFWVMKDGCSLRQASCFQTS